VFSGRSSSFGIIGTARGHEFMAILPETPTDMRRMSQHVRDALSKVGFHIDSKHPIPVSMSCGVSTFPHDGRKAGELLAAADATSTVRSRGVETASPQLRPGTGGEVPRRASSAGNAQYFIDGAPQRRLFFECRRYETTT